MSPAVNCVKMVRVAREVVLQPAVVVLAQVLHHLHQGPLHQDVRLLVQRLGHELAEDVELEAHRAL